MKHSMATPMKSFSVRSLEVSQQVCERFLECVVVLPVGEVGDMVLPNGLGHVLSQVRVEGRPRLDLLRGDRPMGKST